MKRYVYMMLPALLLFAACSGGTEVYYPGGETGSVSVDLSVASLNGTNGTDAATSRAPIDGWNQTTVSLAYRQCPQTVYADNVNVLVQSDADQIIHMGMQYPLDGSNFYVRGYYPAAAPDASGIVRYDISRGDIDLMYTDEVHGNKNTPIINDINNKLLFRHALTRLTVKMKCAQDGSYSERIAGLIVGGKDGQASLHTQAELKLSDGSVSFRAPGTIMAGYTGEGFLIPHHDDPPVVIEALVEPGTALSIRLISTKDNVTDISLEDSALAFLEEEGKGGKAGEQYIINLSFNSQASRVGQIGIVE